MNNRMHAFIIIPLIALLALSTATIIPSEAATSDFYIDPGDNVQTAIDAVAANGGTVYFAPGTYTVNIVVSNPAQSFALVGSGEGVSILDGTGTGSVIQILNSNTMTVTIQGFTIQQGDTSGSTGVGGGIHTHNSTIVISDCTVVDNTTINGGGMYIQSSTGTITGCTFSGNVADGGSGGAIYNWGSSPTITGCTFTGNVADSYSFGGAIYNNEASSPSITECTFVGNTTNGAGGAIGNNKGSSPVITSCTFTGNEGEFAGAIANRYGSESVITDCTFTSNTADSWGGAIYNLTHPDEDADVQQISGCTFTGNGDSSTNYGGAIANNNAAPIIENCTFTGNEAIDGGAMYNMGASPSIAECTFTGNKASYGAGIRSQEGTDLTVYRCVFDGNEATGFGGAMYNISHTDATVQSCVFMDNAAQYGAGIYNNGVDVVTVRSCSFSGNEANYGGAIYVTQSQSLTAINSTFLENEADYGGAMEIGQQTLVTVSNCTFAGNTSDDGGAIRSRATRLTVTNCILWGNGEEIIDFNSSAIVTYSNVQGGWPGAGNIDADPLFVNAPADVSLHAASPCIDAGTDTSAAQYGAVIDDILGTPRPQRAGYDMGAYELIGASWSPVVLQPLARTQLESVHVLWGSVSGMLPEELTDEMALLMAQVQEHMENATQLANPIYATGQLKKAAAAMQQLQALL